MHIKSCCCACSLVKYTTNSSIFIIYLMKSVVLLNFVKNAAKCRNIREDIAADIPQFTRPKKWCVVPYFYIIRRLKFTVWHRLWINLFLTENKRWVHNLIILHYLVIFIVNWEEMESHYIFHNLEFHSMYNHSSLVKTLL